MRGDGLAGDRAAVQRRRGWLGGLAILAMLAVIAAAVMVYRSMGALGESNDSPTPDEIATYTGVKIPVAAYDLHARLELVMTKRTVIARFGIAPADLPAVLAGSPFTALHPSQSQPAVLRVSDPPAWWLPHQARAFSAAEVGRAAMLVDTTQADRYVVYLVARS
jgi:hypothetical protein